MSVTRDACQAMALSSLLADAERVAGILRAAGCEAEVQVEARTDAAIGAALAGPITTTVTVTLRFVR